MRADANTNPDLQRVVDVQGNGQQCVNPGMEIELGKGVAKLEIEEIVMNDNDYEKAVVV